MFRGCVRAVRASSREIFADGGWVVRGWDWGTVLPRAEVVLHFVGGNCSMLDLIRVMVRKGG